jgi:hypothetical protein
MHKILPFIFTLAVPFCSLAVETQIWEQNSQSDFEKGTLKDLSLRSDGRLFLAPERKELLDSSTPYLWALAEDSKGNLYAGGGGPGTTAASLFLIDTTGKTKTLAELEGLEIHAIAIDRKDRVYAATSPDGKVYRIDPGGKPTVFYDPKAKYIWGMAFNSKGELFIATGDSGEVHQVTPDGKGTIFFRTEETHVRSIIVDAKDNVIVGTEPGGLIIRISPAGEGFVLYQSNKREITAVAEAKDGSIYAAGIGNKQPAGIIPTAPSAPLPKTPTSRTTTPPSSTPTVIVQRTPVTAPPTLSRPRPSVSGGSEVYRIDRDGYARKVWTHSEAIVYTIGFDAEGRPLVGTGNKGNLYRLDSDHLSTLLSNAPPTQITGIISGRQGRVYAVTGNVGKVYQIGPALVKEGSLESDVLDVGSFSYWGRLSYHGEAANGSIEFETRSGNLDRPQQNWSSWSRVNLSGETGRVPSPAARFLQYKLVLTAGGEKQSPAVSYVNIAYLPKNVAPVISVTDITPPNYRFPPQSLMLTQTQNITLPALGNRKRAATPKPVVVSGGQSMQYAKGYIGARWLAEDDNGDDLIYKVEIRGRQESEWKLLKDQLKDSYLSWDSTAFPDGEYLLRITVSDSPSNPPHEALTAQLESDLFLIDNSQPRIDGLTASLSGGALRVEWKAVDGRSIIKQAEYSLDGGEWLLVEPITRLSDALQLDYRLELNNVATGEHTIGVRVTDDFDNQAAEKVVVR